MFIYSKVDHSWGAWGSYGACTGECGGGTGVQGRQRNCIPAQPGGEMCPSDNEIDTMACTNDNVCGGKFPLL